MDLLAASPLGLARFERRRLSKARAGLTARLVLPAMLIRTLATARSMLAASTRGPLQTIASHGSGQDERPVKMGKILGQNGDDRSKITGEMGKFPG